jgi:pyrroloquinoline quinone (PQQ) biosynthesis protein C
MNRQRLLILIGSVFVILWVVTLVALFSKEPVIIDGNQKYIERLEQENKDLKFDLVILKRKNEAIKKHQEIDSAHVTHADRTELNHLFTDYLNRARLNHIRH